MVLRIKNPFAHKPPLFPHSYLLNLIITFCVFVDLLNGILVMLIGTGFTIGVYYRGFLTIMLFIISLRSKCFVKYIVWGLIVLFIINNLIWVFNEQYYNFGFDFKIFARHLYPLLIFNFFMINKDKIDSAHIMKLTILYGIIASCAIVFSFITGFGIQTYEGKYSFGVKSFFEGQNDISLMLLFCLILSLYFFIHLKNIKYFIVSVLITAGAFLLGTRVEWLSAFSSGLSVFWGLLFFRFKSSRIHLRFRIALVSGTFVAILLSIALIFTIISQFDNMTKRFTLNAIANGAKYTRDGLIQSAEKVISNGNTLEIAFGQSCYGLWRKNYLNLLQEIKGEYLLPDESVGYRTIESDFIEIYGAYGLFLGIFLLMIPILFTLAAIINFIHDLSLENYLLMIGMLMFLGHAYYAGHAIGSIMTGPPLAVFYFCIYKENMRYRSIRYCV